MRIRLACLGLLLSVFVEYDIHHPWVQISNVPSVAIVGYLIEYLARQNKNKLQSGAILKLDISSTIQYTLIILVGNLYT